MKIAILEDYQDAVRQLACFALLEGHEVDVFTEPMDDVDCQHGARTEVVAIRKPARHNQHCIVLQRDRAVDEAPNMDDIGCSSRHGHRASRIAVTGGGLAVSVGDFLV